MSVQTRRPIIEVRDLAKHYRLGAVGATTLGDTLRRLHRRWKGERMDAGSGDFWALKGISFNVQRGEVVGLIGHNGAGKSTLLKILSRITEPSRGRAILHGRVNSLLEVGTGFHPELTGRDNIFLNGAMLGMKTAEINRKFDEIVDFAQIGEFLDTPVKRYSSGMYVRLAFAVAAHLEPDILVVDEVLAVGDAAFQKKCLGKMNEVAHRGRTILLVSHNLASVQSLCSRVLLLEAGEIRADGAPSAVIGQYLEGQQQKSALDLLARQDRVGDGSVRFKSVSIDGTDADGVVRCTSALRIRLDYLASKPIRHPRFVVSIYDQSETGIFVLDSDAAGGLPEELPAEGSVECVTDPIDLTPGRCFVNLRLFRAGVQTDYVTRAAGFDVEAQDLEGSGKIPTRDWVLCLLRNTWSTVESTP